MPLVEIRDFNGLVGNKNQRRIAGKNLSNCQDIMITQKEIY